MRAGRCAVQANPSPKRDESQRFWTLDTIKGTQQNFPVRGINVPLEQCGCLETDLLQSYGFPVEGQPEHAKFIEIIKKATVKWKVPQRNGKDWWDNPNQKAKFDKFIYVALTSAFGRCLKTGAAAIPPPERLPEVIRNLRAAMGLA